MGNKACKGFIFRLGEEMARILYCSVVDYCRKLFYAVCPVMCLRGENCAFVQGIEHHGRGNTWIILCSGRKYKDA